MQASPGSLPYSQASENNKGFILDVIEPHLKTVNRVLEIGAGTGQHAEYFAAKMPTLEWQTSDLESNIATLSQRLNAARLHNLPGAVALDVNDTDWQCGNVQAIYSANSLHIMSESSVVAFFKGVGRHLPVSGVLLIYGPFKYNNQFTTESNAQFDNWLKSRDQASGIRDFEIVNALAISESLQLIEDIAMPANNQLLVWVRK